MNRRKFNALTIAALGATAFGITSPTTAAPNSAKDQQTGQTFRYRFRYARKGGTYWIWMRVSDPQNLGSDVPVTLEFATDAAGSKIISATNHVSRSIDSHIVRKKITIDSQMWQGTAPLYCALRMGNDRISSKIYKVLKS